jgi:hypothetical protein
MINPKLTGLTATQASGLACVWCDAELAAVRVPVGGVAAGPGVARMVFACDGPCSAHVQIFRIFEREFGDSFGEFRDTSLREWQLRGICTPRTAAVAMTAVAAR